MQDALFGVDQPEDGPSRVYAIGAEGSSVVKIGVTTDLAKRLAGIQNGNPNRLVVRWKAPGDRMLEKWLHVKFQRHRMSGEWFDFRDQDPIAAIQDAVASIGVVPITDEDDHSVTNETALPGVADEIESQGPFYSPYPSPDDPDHDNPDYAPHPKFGCRCLTPAELVQAGMRPTDHSIWCFCDFPGHYCWLNLI